MALNLRRFARREYAQGAAVVAALLVVILLFVWVAQSAGLDTGRYLGFDWYAIWNSLQGGHVIRGQGCFNPPWSLSLLLPLGYLSLAWSLSVVLVLTLLGLLLSIPAQPARWRFLLALGVMFTGYPVLRLLADTNLEGLQLLGILLLGYAFRRQRALPLVLSLLLLTLKPQATWLLILAVAWGGWQVFSRRQLALLVALLALDFVPTMLLDGANWFATLPSGSNVHAGMPLAVTLWQSPLPVVMALALAVVGLTVFTAWRSRHAANRSTVGLLIVASLLAAPHANYHSMTLVFVLVVLPMVLGRPRSGLPLLLLYDLPLLIRLHTEFGITFEAHIGQYWCAILALTWGVVMIQTWHRLRQQAATPQPMLPAADPVPLTTQHRQGGYAPGTAGEPQGRFARGV